MIRKGVHRVMIRRSRKIKCVLILLTASTVVLGSYFASHKNRHSASHHHAESSCIIKNINTSNYDVDWEHIWHTSFGFLTTSNDTIHKINMKKGQKKILKYNTEIKDGDFNIKIFDPDGNEVDVIKANEKGSKYIEALTEGTYKVIVTAKKAKGRYVTEVCECGKESDDLNKTKNHHHKDIKYPFDKRFA